MPETPLRIAFKKAGTPTPFGETTPKPVMTTRRLIISSFSFTYPGGARNSTFPDHAREYPFRNLFAFSVLHHYLALQFVKSEIDLAGNYGNFLSGQHHLEERYIRRCQQRKNRSGGLRRVRLHQENTQNHQ